MKTRILQTKFWADGFVSSLTPMEKIIFLYYLTNEKVNIIHCYECPDRYVLLDTGVSREVLQRCKDKLQGSNKIKFYKDYVLLVNAAKYEAYRGKDNETAKQKLIGEMSSDVLAWYNNKNNTPVQKGVESGVATPTINHKPEIINHKGVVKGENHFSYLQEIPPNDLEDFLKAYQCTEKQVLSKADDLYNYCQAKGKKYSDYKAFLKNALKRDFGERNNKPVEKKPLLSDLIPNYENAV